MALKPPHSYVVDCPPSGPDANHSQATRAPQPQVRKPLYRRKVFQVSLFIVVGLAVIIVLGVLMGVFLGRERANGNPEFSVAVAGVAGLDNPARDVVPAAGDGGRLPPSLSPVFNLTFHINNTRNRDYDACVPGLSTVAVSYGDAFLGRGSVPPFCAEKKHESEPMAVRAWSDGVAVPRFLRDQLAAELAAGEAAVDVKVTMPRYCTYGCLWGEVAVLSCKAKIIGGVSPPCRLDYAVTRDHSGDDD